MGIFGSVLKGLNQAKKIAELGPYAKRVGDLYIEVRRSMPNQSPPVVLHEVTRVVIETGGSVFSKHLITSHADLSSLIISMASLEDIGPDYTIDPLDSSLHREAHAHVCKTLRHLGFSEKEIESSSLSASDWDALKRWRETNPIVREKDKPERQSNHREAVGASSPKTALPRAPATAAQPKLQKSYPSWAHELAALELENLKFDRSLWDSIVVASSDDITVAKATYIEKRAATLLAKEKGAPAKPAEFPSPQSRPLANPFQVAAEAVRKLNIIEVRMRVIVDPSICKESDGEGNTLLLIAASVGALAILEFLLANGSYPLHRNSAGKTAIDLVRGNLSIVDFNRDRLVKAIETKIAEISAGRSANQAPPPQASSIGDAESRCPHCGATVRFHAHTLRCPGCFRTLFNT